ncbi:hypothetical protein AOLI_G00247530 [Acnodon oligacanthus]
MGRNTTMQTHSPANQAASRHAAQEEDTELNQVRQWLREVQAGVVSGDTTRASHESPVLTMAKRDGTGRVAVSPLGKSCARSSGAAAASSTSFAWDSTSDSAWTAKKGPAECFHTPLQTLHSSAPMERVGVDVLGPFPETERGNKYVSVAMDYFTKWLESDGLVERFNRTLATQLAMVVEGDQIDLELQLPLVLIYASPAHAWPRVKNTH